MLGVGSQHWSERGLSVSPGGQASVQEDGEDTCHGLDIRWQLLQWHLHPGPLPSRGPGHWAEGDCGVNTVQGGLTWLPLPWPGPGAWQCRSSWSSDGSQVDQREYNNVWWRSVQNNIILRLDIKGYQFVFSVDYNILFRISRVDQCGISHVVTTVTWPVYTCHTPVSLTTQSLGAHYCQGSQETFTQTCHEIRMSCQAGRCRSG